MNLKKVLFLGGDPARFASVQIRCIDIARCIGVDYALKSTDLDQIPRGYSCFLCVKPALTRPQISELAKRGRVIWDILDTIPPEHGVDVLLSSTARVQKFMRQRGRVEHIPHHHCNFDGVPNSPRLRRPGWIGNREWCPRLPGLRFAPFFIHGATQAAVIGAHRQLGIGLNFRRNQRWRDPMHPEKLHHDFHVSINSGIKLINSIGFGVPSVSSQEPAYLEIGDDFTIFSEPEDCAGWVKELKANKTLYETFRNRCLRKARDYHIRAVGKRYLRLLRSL